MSHYLAVATKEGITKEEVETVQAIVMAVSAGKVRAQFREAQRGTKVTAKNGEKK